MLTRYKAMVENYNYGSRVGNYFPKNYKGLNEVHSISNSGHAMSYQLHYEITCI